MCFVVLSTLLRAQGLDSLARVSLGEKIEAYFGALAVESLEVQKAEADFMIGLSTDSLIRQFTAAKIYEYYMTSPVMGAENVAVHIYDEWFKDGRVKMNSDLELMNARIFAEFNRRSLIGEKAPDLRMEAMDGTVVELFSEGDSKPKYRVLYFYDSGCAKCKMESILLRNMLLTENFPIEFYAIYAGDNRPAWESYVRERFDLEKSAAEIIHLWDPELDSDFQKKYGVIQTPRMLLVSPDGMIMGRGLDAKALSVMLHKIFDVPELQYGGKESAELFDGIFGVETSADDVKRIADYIETTTLGQGNSVMFRQLTGDMLYWLSSRSEEAFKEGTDYLLDSKILSRPEIWCTADDSLKVVGLAQFLNALLDKSRPGTEIESLKLPAERVKSGKSKKGEFRLDRMCGRRNIVIFYTEGCGNCDAQKAAARELAREDRKVQVLMVNVDEIISSAPDMEVRLFDTFDLSTLPFILETDRRGVIRRRYMDLQNDSL